MAVFDRASDRIVVHVVYDGPALAGKTTNLEQLCGFFTQHRRSELHTTGNVGERTVFLDWLQLEGGVVAGRKLRCQMITVPGQTVLARRRWHLLKRADVVVFVMEATPKGIDEARVMFDMVTTYCRELDRELPLVVQANKQDLPDALSPVHIAQRLHFEPKNTIAAQANAGTGVRETAVIAIRAAADIVQQRVLAEGLDAIAGEASNGLEIQEAIEREEKRNPQSPIAVMLEHGGGRHRLKTDTNKASPEPPPSTPRLEQVLAAKTTPPLGSGEPRVDSTRSVSTKYPAEVLETTPLRDTLPTGMAAPALGRPRALVDLAPGLALGVASDRVPTLPQPTVASGFIWPAATGRELLRNVPIDGAMLRSDSVVGSGESDAQPRIFVYEAGTWCLRTSSTLCFDSTDKARDALLSLVRRKISLGPLLMSDTVLTLQSDPQGGYWLWTVTPWVVTLEQALAEHLASPSRLEKLLVSYAGALMTGLRYAMRRRVCLGLEPANFAAFRGVTYYVGDEIRQGDWPVEIATRLLHPVEQFGEEATRSYVHELVQGLRADLRGTGGGDRLLSELSGLVTTEGLAVARRRLIEALA